MIAVDIMGGDNAPQAAMEGAIRAARRGIPVLLCGHYEVIINLLPLDWKDLPISLQFCTEKIGMDEEPSKAVRTKKNSSLVTAMKAVAEGTAEAFFSAGNSGAVLVATVLYVGRVPGVHRPAVGLFLPTKTGSFFCLDMGGNVDCRPEHLYQFALMGQAYVQLTRQTLRPRIALLSNGHESSKGPEAVKQAYKMLHGSSLHFVGNIEARDLWHEDRIDVLVCDGFAGNILLKSIQGTATALFDWIKHAAHASWWHSLLLWLNKGVFQPVKERLDYAATGGALLLGVNRPVILAHGRSNARAIENGILFAHQVVQEQRVSRYNETLSHILHPAADTLRKSVAWGKKSSSSLQRSS